MKQSTIGILNNSRSLAATLYVPEITTGSALLFGHGHGRSRRDFEPYAHAATSAGSVCLAYDLGGHGDSKNARADDLTIQDHISDMTAAFDSVANRWGVDASRVGIFGHSFSGNLALQVAALRPLKQLLLQAPAIYDDSVAAQARRHYNPVVSRAWREQSPIPITECAALRAAAAYSGTLTVAESEHDEILPSTVARSLIAVAANGVHAVVLGASHVLSTEQQATFSDEILSPWVQKL